MSKLVPGSASLLDPVVRCTCHTIVKVSSCRSRRRPIHARLQKRAVTVHASKTLFGALFSGKQKESRPGTNDIWTRVSDKEKAQGINVEEIVVIEQTKDDGRKAQIVYRNGGIVSAAALEALCVRVGWPERPAAKVEAALRNSFMVSTLMLRISGPGLGGDDQADERLVGLARATSDHAFNATIWDVLVDPEFQGLGLGKTLVEKVVRSLLRQDITNITLFADARVVDFYQNLGFTADPEGIKHATNIQKVYQACSAGAATGAICGIRPREAKYSNSQGLGRIIDAPDL